MQCHRVKIFQPAPAGSQIQVAGLTGKHSYHVAVRAGFYRKEVEVSYIYLDPVIHHHDAFHLGLPCLQIPEYS